MCWVGVSTLVSERTVRSSEEEPTLHLVEEYKFIPVWVINGEAPIVYIESTGLLLDQLETCWRRGGSQHFLHHLCRIRWWREGPEGQGSGFSYQLTPPTASPSFSSSSWISSLFPESLLATELNDGDFLYQREEIRKMSVISSMIRPTVLTEHVQNYLTRLVLNNVRRNN